MAGEQLSPPPRFERASSASSQASASDSESPMHTTEIVTSSNQRSAHERSTSQSTKITHFGASHFETTVSEDGTLHLHPIPKKSAVKGKKHKIKHVVSFEPRFSVFDRFNPASQSDTFRGFYTLFWILMLLQVTKTFRNTYLKEGSLMTWRFGRLISEDALLLGLSDAIMVGSSILCVPLIKLVEKGWIRYYWTGVNIQHIIQACFLGISIRWTFFRNWYWTQSGFFVIHTITMLMKIHSYLAHNGALSARRDQLVQTREKLEKAVADAGGPQIAGALARREVDWNIQLEKEKQGGTPRSSPNVLSDETPKAEPESLSGEPPQLNGHATTTSHQPQDGHNLKRRRKSGVRSPLSAGASLQPELPTASLELLSWHPDEEIATLADLAIDLEDELTSKTKKVRWPDNVTYTNFVDYLLVPTLCYELEYPRTNKIRPLYVLEKVLATFGTFSLIYIITEIYIFPVEYLPDKSFVDIILELALPFSVQYLLIFYIIFECICNAFAELTMFADREFYQDWWNSTTWDQFARRWNKPVHSFLMRHVYASTLSTYGISKSHAALFTFFLSACFHELVMAIVSKKIRMYLFVLQMIQVPLIAIGRMPMMRKNPALGNVTFWIGLLSGPPLLAIGYLVL